MLLRRGLLLVDVPPSLNYRECLCAKYKDTAEDGEEFCQSPLVCVCGGGGLQCVCVRRYMCCVYTVSSTCMTSLMLLVSSPYDGKWSKTMVGYGPEDDHFAVELTYNYGIKAYKRGNDFQVH